jgi:O-succinylbenzoic acid--CoA ligase
MIDSAAPALLAGRESISWAELDRRCAAIADRLRSAGVPAGGVVALDGSSSLEAAVSVLAIVRAGAVAAPLPNGRTATETAAILALLDPVLVLDGDEVAGPGRSLDGPAVVVLTSGTTAAPRGVVLPTAALDASAAAWLGALPPAAGWLLALGLSHVAGIGVLWRALAERVPTRIEAPGDPVAQLEALRGFPALSHVSLVPTQLGRLLDEAGDGPPPTTLRAVLLGGGIIPPGLVTRAVAAGWPVVPTYGLSEAGSGVTALPTDEARSYPESAGRALPGVSVSIADPDGDGIGEIVVITPARFAGYVDDARSEGPIRTGDLGRLDDEGRLTVVDRRTDRIVRGGENVSPAEVEAVLTALPWVAQAAVVARRDGALGQLPVAAVVLRRDVADPGDDAILRACRDSLAGYKAPDAIVRLDALPMTAGGKLRREAVRALVDGEASGMLARPGGDEIGWRVTGSGPASILLLPGTLSNAAQLGRLATELAQAAEATVHAIDRRGMGTSRLADPAPLDVDVHVRDLVAYLEARGIERAILLGVSFGGVVALELAARHPGLVATLVVWEPPYGPAAGEATRHRFATLAADTAAAHRTSGAPGAAETFLRAVAGDAAWDRLPPKGRTLLAREGDAALTDSALVGLDLEGLGRIEAPTTILTGSSSEPFYAPIAEALAHRIPGARRRTLDGLGHPAPITDAARIADAFRDAVGPPSTTEPVPLETRP